jgi:DNA-binding CsgD family transcriptional regulator
MPKRELSGREKQILAMTAGGQTTRMIADALGLARVTVEDDLRHAGRKLGAINRIHTVVIAIKEGLIEPQRAAIVED